MTPYVRPKTSTPCSRCGKKDYYIGKITQYGPVCKSCAAYFKPLIQCNQCKQFSTHVVFHENEYLCQKCLRKDYGTCSACHRYRKLYLDIDSKLLCKRCLTIGMSTCGICGKPLPAGYGKICEDCYWTRLLRKRATIDSLSFISKTITRNFDDFSIWLLSEVGPQKAALKIHCYYIFFLNLDHTWGMIPSYPVLVHQFGVAYLRKYLVVFRWLRCQNLLTIDPKIKVEDQKSRYIAVLLSKVPRNSPNYEIVESFYNEILKEYDNKKTIYCFLVAAVGLLNSARSFQQQLPNQIILNEYLSQKPGQRASVTKFLKFLNTNYNLCLSVSIVDQSNDRKRMKKKIEKEIVMLIHDNVTSKKKSRRWIVCCLRYFHNLPAKSIPKHLKYEISDGISVMIKDKIYWIPLIKTIIEFL